MLVGGLGVGEQVRFPGQDQVCKSSLQMNAQWYWPVVEFCSRQ